VRRPFSCCAACNTSDSRLQWTLLGGAAPFRVCVIPTALRVTNPSRATVRNVRRRANVAAAAACRPRASSGHQVATTMTVTELTDRPRLHRPFVAASVTHHLDVIASLLRQQYRQCSCCCCSRRRRHCRGVAPQCVESTAQVQEMSRHHHLSNNDSFILINIVSCILELRLHLLAVKR
jgi:hypothetical protein